LFCFVLFCFVLFVCLFVCLFCFVLFCLFVCLFCFVCLFVCLFVFCCCCACVLIIFWGNGGLRSVSCTYSCQCLWIVHICTWLPLSVFSNVYSSFHYHFFLSPLFIKDYTYIQEQHMDWCIPDVSSLCPSWGANTVNDQITGDYLN